MSVYPARNVRWFFSYCFLVDNGIVSNFYYFSTVISSSSIQSIFSQKYLISTFFCLCLQTSIVPIEVTKKTNTKR